MEKIQNIYDSLPKNLKGQLKRQGPEWKSLTYAEKALVRSFEENKQKEVLKEVKPKQVEPKEVKPKQVEPKEVKPKEVKPKEVKPKEVKPKEVKPKEVPKEVELEEKQNDLGDIIPLKKSIKEIVQERKKQEQEQQNFFPNQPNLNFEQNTQHNDLDDVIQLKPKIKPEDKFIQHLNPLKIEEESLDDTLSTSILPAFFGKKKTKIIKINDSPKEETFPQLQDIYPQNNQQELVQQPQKSRSLFSMVTGNK
jgi:hypothetical protein